MINNKLETSDEILYKDKVYKVIGYDRKYYELIPVDIEEGSKRLLITRDEPYTLYSDCRKKGEKYYGNNKIMMYLDYKEERDKAITTLKEKVFELVEEEYECELALGNDGPHRKDTEKRLSEIYSEKIWRMQDYQVFMWDYRKDWDLNYSDYPINFKEEEIS